MNEYTHCDLVDGFCTKEQYEAQFNPIQLEVGKEYEQAPFSWGVNRFLVIHIDGPVALAKTTNKFGTSYELFSARTGFKYQDTRISAYQLREISDK